MEQLQATLQRLSKNNIKFVELHGNLYGKDLGYKPAETIRALNENGMKTSGICGMVHPYSEFASNNHYLRQACIDYNNKNCFCTLEPLGGGSNPYDMLYGQPDIEAVDALVSGTADYFFERENELLNAADDELLAMYGGR